MMRVHVVTLYSMLQLAEHGHMMKEGCFIRFLQRVLFTLCRTVKEISVIFCT